MLLSPRPLFPTAYEESTKTKILDRFQIPALSLAWKIAPAVSTSQSSDSPQTRAYQGPTLPNRNRDTLGKQITHSYVNVSTMRHTQSGLRSKFILSSKNQMSMVYRGMCMYFFSELSILFVISRSSSRTVGDSWMSMPPDSRRIPAVWVAISFVYLSAFLCCSSTGWSSNWLCPLRSPFGFRISDFPRSRYPLQSIHALI